MEELEASVFVPFKHLLKAPSRKAVEEMFAAAYKARHVHPPPPKLVEATAAALQIEAPEALKVPTATLHSHPVSHLLLFIIFN
jgi:hypothetical protein